MPLPHSFNQLLTHKNILPTLWIVVILVVFVKHSFLSSFHNNYYVYKYAYLHAAEGKSLYGFYPEEYLDKFNYGPVFILFIAPVALLPDAAGLLLWVAMLVLPLLYAIQWLPLARWQTNAILLICFNELLTASFNVQFNVILAACIILSFVLIKRQKEFWAPLPLLFGAFVKLYGIVGLAFFFLVKDKRVFILGCLFWSFFLFALPMVMCSPDYVVHMYGEWYTNLIIKNSENVELDTYQDISVMGFVRRLVQDPSIPNWPFLAGGMLLFGSTYLRISQYKHKAYQLLLLASTLIFPIIFSSSSESPTYIIAFTGIAIWFVIQPRPYTWPTWALLIAAFLFGSFNSADFYPLEWRNFIRVHSIKAVPCLLIWLTIVYEMLFRNFDRYTTGEPCVTVPVHQTLK